MKRLLETFVLLVLLFVVPSGVSSSFTGGTSTPDVCGDCASSYPNGCGPYSKVSDGEGGYYYCCMLLGCDCCTGATDDGGWATPCPPGTYNPATGETPCTDCAAGTYAQYDFNFVCDKCPAGKTSKAGATSCYSITSSPSKRPTKRPTRRPTRFPSRNPSRSPVEAPTPAPTPSSPITSSPSKRPTKRPTRRPTRFPSRNPSRSPVAAPTPTPSSGRLTRRPTRSPSRHPSRSPVASPSSAPTPTALTTVPTRQPTKSPSTRQDGVSPLDPDSCDAGHYFSPADMISESWLYGSAVHAEEWTITSEPPDDGARYDNTCTAHYVSSLCAVGSLSSTIDATDESPKGDECLVYWEGSYGDLTITYDTNGLDITASKFRTGQYPQLQIIQYFLDGKWIDVPGTRDYWDPGRDDDFDNVNDDGDPWWSVTVFDSPATSSKWRLLGLKEKDEICEFQLFGAHHDSWYCVACELGKFNSEKGLYSCENCPAGKYGDTPGGVSSKCSGSCEESYYCPPGSTSATQQPCPEGFYCGPGTPDPEQCPDMYARPCDNATLASCKDGTSCMYGFCSGLHVQPAQGEDEYCTLFRVFANRYTGEVGCPPGSDCDDFYNLQSSTNVLYWLSFTQSFVETVAWTLTVYNIRKIGSGDADGEFNGAQWLFGFFFYAGAALMIQSAEVHVVTSSDFKGTLQRLSDHSCWPLIDEVNNIPTDTGPLMDDAEKMLTYDIFGLVVWFFVAFSGAGYFRSSSSSYEHICMRLSTARRSTRGWYWFTVAMIFLKAILGYFNTHFTSDAKMRVGLFRGESGAYVEDYKPVVTISATNCLAAQEDDDETWPEWGIVLLTVLCLWICTPIMYFACVSELGQDIYQKVGVCFFAVSEWGDQMWIGSVEALRRRKAAAEDKFAAAKAAEEDRKRILNKFTDQWLKEHNEAEWRRLKDASITEPDAGSRRSEEESYFNLPVQDEERESDLKRHLLSASASPYRHSESNELSMASDFPPKEEAEDRIGKIKYEISECVEMYCREHIVKYTTVWGTVQTQKAQLAELGEIIKEKERAMMKEFPPPDEEPRQPDIDGLETTARNGTMYLTRLEAEFKAVEGSMYDDVKDLLEKLLLEKVKCFCVRQEGRTCKLKIGPAKKKDRCIKKAQLAYGGDFAKLKDLRRASILCTTLDDIIAVLKKLFDHPRIKIIRIKNRFAPDYNANVRSAGYRDLQLNVVVPGTELIWELQLHLVSIERIKSDKSKNKRTGTTGHEGYIIFRECSERLQQEIKEIGEVEKLRQDVASLARAVGDENISRMHYNERVRKILVEMQKKGALFTKAEMELVRSQLDEVTKEAARQGRVLTAGETELGECLEIQSKLIKEARERNQRDAQTKGGGMLSSVSSRSYGW